MIDYVSCPNQLFIIHSCASTEFAAQSRDCCGDAAALHPQEDADGEHFQWTEHTGTTLMYSINKSVWAMGGSEKTGVNCGVCIKSD